MPESDGSADDDVPERVIVGCDWPDCGWLSEPAEPLRAQAQRLVHLSEDHEQPL